MEALTAERPDGSRQEDARRDHAIRQDAGDQAAGSTTDIATLLFLGDQETYPAVVPLDGHPAAVLLPHADPLVQHGPQLLRLKSEIDRTASGGHVLGEVDGIRSQQVGQLDDAPAVLPVETGRSEADDDAHLSLGEPADG